MKLAAIDFRNNAIGFLRFFFAAAVIFSHAFGLGGFGYDALNKLNRNSPSIGLLAVGGFFVLSGFLIARSYETVSGPARFLWHRCLRIFPGYWVCLLLTAFIVAPLIFYREHGTLAAFLTQRPAPQTFIGANFLLEQGQSSIGELLANLPYPFALNSSLWTLGYEFACYISLASVGIVGLLKRAPALVGTVALLFYLWYIVVLWKHAGQGMPVILEPISLFLYFSVGAYAYTIRNRIRLLPWLAGLCAAVMLLALPSRVFAYVAIPLVAYLTLCAAAWVPIRNFDRRIDLSYGIYIYAFPIQQLLAMYGANRLGLLPYFGVALAISALVAACSWFIVEKPMLGLKNVPWPLWSRRQEAGATQ